MLSPSTRTTKVCGCQAIFVLDHGVKVLLLPFISRFQVDETKFMMYLP